DSVDQHLAEVAVQPRGRRAARIAALLIFLLSFTPSVSLVSLVVSILAIISGSAASLAALGTTTVIAGALAFAKRPEFFPSALVMIFATAGILIGVLSLILVRRIPKEERGRHVRFVVVSLSIIAF